MSSYFLQINSITDISSFVVISVIGLLRFQAKPSQEVVAAKRNARMCQANNKKIPDIVIKDIYHTVR